MDPAAQNRSLVSFKTASRVKDSAQNPKTDFAVAASFIKSVAGIQNKALNMRVNFGVPAAADCQGNNSNSGDATCSCLKISA